jgi:hypothetical protein
MSDRLIKPGVLLSGVSLPSWPTGAMMNLGSWRGPRAFLTVHSAACKGCRKYIGEDLASAAARLTEWGGHLVVVVPGQVENANGFAEIVPNVMQVLTDHAGEVATGTAKVVIADQWGEVYFVKDSGATHDLPTLSEIAEWIRFLAIQCPECEGPEGDWRTVSLEFP